MPVDVEKRGDVWVCVAMRMRIMHGMLVAGRHHGPHGDLGALREQTRSGACARTERCPWYGNSRAVCRSWPSSMFDLRQRGRAQGAVGRRDHWPWEILLKWPRHALAATRRRNKDVLRLVLQAARAHHDMPGIRLELSRGHHGVRTGRHDRCQSWQQ